MKRLWLEWTDERERDRGKATGIWEGRLWDVELEEGFTEATLWGVNLKAGDETVRLIASEWDSDQGNHPLWIDCVQAMGMDDFYDAMRHMAQTVVQDVSELVRNEIRENGIMRHIFPPEAVTTVAEERARQMVDMVSSDDMLQGLRRMQESGSAAAWASEALELMSAPGSSAPPTLVLYPDRTPQRITMDLEVR